MRVGSSNPEVLDGVLHAVPLLREMEGDVVEVEEEKVRDRLEEHGTCPNEDAFESVSLRCRS